MTARPAGPALIAGRPRMCAENDRRCRWTRTERPTVANVCRKRQNMSLDAQIGEAPRAAAGVFKSAVPPRDTPRTRNRPTTAKMGTTALPRRERSWHLLTHALPGLGLRVLIGLTR